MSVGHIYYAQYGRVFVLKLLGTLKLCDVRAIDEFCLNAVKVGQVNQVIIDMTELQFLDSTSLGLVANLATCLNRDFNIKPCAVCNAPEIINLLVSMCIDRVLDIINEIPIVKEKNETPFSMLEMGECGSEKEVCLQSLRAHKALMLLSESNILKFKEVVEQLEKDLKK